MHSRVVLDRSSYGLQPSPTRCANVDAASLPRRITIQPGRGRDAASTLAPCWDWEVFLSWELWVLVLLAVLLLLCPAQAFAGDAARGTRIIHISDLHFSSASKTLDGDYWVDSQNSRLRSEVLSRYLIENKARLGANRIVITGDITDSGDVADYTIARAFIAKLKHKGFDVYCVPGNHDCSKEGTLALGQRERGQNATRRENFSKYVDQAPFPRVVDLHGGWLILLDSLQGELASDNGNNFAQGALGPEQLAKLRSEIERLQKDRRAGKKIVVCLHHSPFKIVAGDLPPDGSLSLHSKGGLEDAKEFLGIVAGKIDCLLFGHTSPAGSLQQGHESFKVQRRVYGIPIINCENLEHSSWNAGLELQGTAKQLCMAANADGRLEVFYAGADGQIFHDWQAEPNNGWKGSDTPDSKANTSWHGEEALDGRAKQICAGLNHDGLIEICYIGMDGRLGHNWQTAPGGPWHGEEMLDAQWLAKGDEGLRQIWAERNSSGHLDLFYVATDATIRHLGQSALGGAWDCMDGLGGPAQQICVGRNQDGRIELLYTAPDYKIWRNWQTAPNGAWHGPKQFGPQPFFQMDDAALQLCMGQNPDGRLEVFYVGTNGLLYHNWQTAPNGAWHGEKGMGEFPGNHAVQLCVAPNKDGRLEVFYTGRDTIIYHDCQTVPNGDWAGEELLRGLRESAKQICAMPNRDGRIELCYTGINGRLWHNFQTIPNAPYPITVIDLERNQREVFHTGSPEPAEVTTESE